MKTKNDTYRGAGVDNKSGVDGQGKSLTLVEFKKMLNHKFPDFYPYILRRLNMAELTGALPKSDYTASAVLDSVYKGLYQRFKNKPERIDNLKIWIYQIGEMILEEALQEENFEEKHAMALAQLQEKELADLEEVYTVDAEGELVLVEDLDEKPSFQHYDALTIIQDESTLEEVESRLAADDKKVLHQEIRKLLIQLPETERTIFDLFWLGELEIQQIAEIRNLTAAEVSTILQNVTLSIKKSLHFLIDKGRI